MKGWHKYFFALLLCSIGIAMGLYTTDREFINLPPTAGSDFILPLDSTTTYQFKFTVNRTSLTRLGFWIKPLRENLPGESITIRVQRGEARLAEVAVATPFIDSQGFTQIRFSSPLSTIPGEQLTSHIIVPTALQGALGVRLRQLDGSFAPDDAQLFVNGRASASPLAYQAYFRHHPALAIVISAMLIMGSLLLLFSPRKLPSPFVLGLLVSTVAVMPAVVLGNYPWWLWFAQAIAWTGMYQLLNHLKVSIAARFVGAHYSGLTTYWALHYLGGTASLLLLAALPFAVYLIIVWPRYRALTVAGAVGLTIAAFALLPAGLPSLGLGGWRDVFLDPYQVASSQKTSNGLPWQHYGSYLGLFGAALASLGVLATGWRRPLLICLLIGSLAIYYSGLLIAWPAAYSIIIITYLLAYAAAMGLHSLQRYLGSGPTTHYLLLVLGAVIFLDVLFVLSTTLETHYL